MKKHLIGFSAFLLIIVTFAIFQFENEKIEVNMFEIPTVDSDSLVSMRTKKTENEIISSQYFSDEDKVVTKVRLRQSDYKFNKERLRLTAIISTSSHRLNQNGFGTVQSIENPFNDAKDQEITIVTRIDSSRKFLPTENLYVSLYINDGNYEETIGKKPVLFVHGEQ